MKMIFGQKEVWKKKITGIDCTNYDNNARWWCQCKKWYMLAYVFI